MACEDTYNSVDPFSDKAAYEAQYRALKQKYDALVVKVEKIQRTALGHIEVDSQFRITGYDLMGRSRSFGTMHADCQPSCPGG